MPGPKMGPRPPDFDEEVIRQSPTFKRWMALAHGEKLKYACREFIKGSMVDEERLMRRIMIARRNNIRDHETLKKARKLRPNVPHVATTTTKRRKKLTLPPSDPERDMDVTAVEATRSYCKWRSLRHGQEFVYNQRYIKGKEGHDWLLRKNIWRRMRYRRMNKQMVESLKTVEPDDSVASPTTDGVTAATKPTLQRQHSMQEMMDSILQSSDGAASDTATHDHHSVVDAPPTMPTSTPHDLLAVHATTAAANPTSSTAEQAAAAAAAAAVVHHYADSAAVEAAVAAAEHFGKASSVATPSHGGMGAPPVPLVMSQYAPHYPPPYPHYWHPQYFPPPQQNHPRGESFSEPALHAATPSSTNDAQLPHQHLHPQQHSHPGAPPPLLMNDQFPTAAAQAALDAAARLAHISHPPTGLGDDDDDEVTRRFLLDDDGDEVGIDV